MKKLWALFTYINYLFSSRSRYTTHSPFVYDLINNVLRDKTSYRDFVSLNKYRKKVEASKTIIDTVDFGSGAGNREYKEYKERVGKIAKRRTHSKKHLEILYKLTRYLKPAQMLEFGTAVGFSSLYMQKGFRKGKLTTMEGCTVLSQIAVRGFKIFNADDINMVIGNFDTNIVPVLEKMETLDFVFFDGNHSKEPTLFYFEECMEKRNEDSVFVFDDIHWSPGMSSAWKKIKQDSRVSFTIDIYWIGLVFFKKGFAKQDFIINY